MHMESKLRKLLIASTYFTVFLVSCNAYSEELGLVEQRKGNIYLHSSSLSIKPNSPVHLIRTGVILRVKKRVEPQLKHTSNISIRSKYSTAYLLQGEKELELNNRMTAAVILTVENNKKPQIIYKYSYCTSNEGVHHSIYSVGKGKKERLWSAYEYLPYAVEPSCSDSEYAEQ